MAGVNSLQQESVPPDPGSGLSASDSGHLDPSQFPPLLSPEALLKAQCSSPSFAWVFKKKGSPPLSMDSLDSPMVNLEASSTAMDTSSPTTMPPLTSTERVEPPKILPSLKNKEMATISAKYTTLSAKAKGISPKAATKSVSTVANPNPDAIIHSQQSLGTPTLDEIQGGCAEPMVSSSPPELPAQRPGKHTKTTHQDEVPSVTANPPNLQNKENLSNRDTAKTPLKTSSYAGKARVGTDRSLKRLAPLDFSPEGIPQVTIPDEVFNRGAEAHKDFVLGVFTGKTPSYSQIQSVLTHIWGKGSKLEIHLRPSSRSMLVKIPNEFIRQKVVEQEIWYIGSSMFFVAQWSAQVAVNPPTMHSIPLWAHVRGVPFDLYPQEGLSLVAGLIGDPVEADEFTIRMVSLDVAHLKVRANCSRPLPPVVELKKQDGFVIPVTVTYPWVPPSCSCCKRLGHLENRCPNAKWAPASSSRSQEAGSSIPKSTHPPENEGTNHQDPVNACANSNSHGVPSEGSMHSNKAGQASSPSGLQVPLVMTPSFSAAGLQMETQQEICIANATSSKPTSESSEIVIFSHNLEDPNKSFSSSMITHVVGLEASRPFITAKSKKRKGSHLSRTSSPDSTGGFLNPKSLPELSSTNLFAVLEPGNLRDLDNHNIFSSSFRPDTGTLKDTAITTLTLVESNTTPVKGSSPLGLCLLSVPVGLLSLITRRMKMDTLFSIGKPLQSLPFFTSVDNL